jgi:hypothetical protein
MKPAFAAYGFLGRQDKTEITGLLIESGQGFLDLDSILVDVLVSYYNYLDARHGML